MVSNCYHMCEFLMAVTMTRLAPIPIMASTKLLEKSIIIPKDIRIRDMIIDDIPPVYHLGTKVFTKDKDIYLYRTWETYEVISRRLMLTDRVASSGASLSNSISTSASRCFDFRIRTCELSHVLESMRPLQ
jgi:hypothetical protein